MTRTQKLSTVAAAIALLAGAGAISVAQPQGPRSEPPACHGMGMGRGMGHDGKAGGSAGADMQGIHFLFAHRDSITRTVKEVPGGVQTVTESDDAEVAPQLHAHVQAMYARLKDGAPIHARDPLFAELFRNADRIDARIEKTPKGVRVTETSSAPEVVKLIRRHAEVVSAFLKNGMPEMMKNH
jgi:hypothetical protein